MVRNGHVTAGIVALMIGSVLFPGSRGLAGAVEITGEYRVRLSRLDYSSGTAGDHDIAEQNLTLDVYSGLTPAIDLFVRVETDWKYGLRTSSGTPEDGFTNSIWATYRDNAGKYLNLAYISVIDVLESGIDLSLGRQPITVGHNLVLADEVDGCSLTRYFFEQIRLQFFAFDKHEFLDSAVPGNPAAAAGQTLGQDWKLISESGLNVLGLTFAVDIGDHAFTGYRIRDSWAHFDPYTRLGQALGSAPPADSSYTGGTADGYLTPQLLYLFEFCSFDPDLPGMDAAEMLYLGFDWFATETTSIYASYGRGDKRFVPVLIGPRYFFRGLGGRRTSAGAGLYRGWNHLLGTGSLGGVRDYLLKVTHSLDERTSCWVQFEAAADYDGTGNGAAGNQQDYRLYVIGCRRYIRDAVSASLEYRTLRYESGVVDNLPGGGGWKQLGLEITYSF